MALEISGKVIHLLQEQTGTGKNGVWVRQDFVVETNEQYPKKICFSAWGDKASLVKNLVNGQQVKVSFNPESREYNGKWYTDLRIWKLETNAQSSSSSSHQDLPPLPDEPDFSDNSNQSLADDLPF